MSGRSTVLIVALVAAITLGGAGCSVIRTLTGTSLDPEQFARAREAKTLEIRLQESVGLAERLQRSNPYLDGDMTLQVSERMLNTWAQWYRGRTGWLDEQTQYTVDSIHITLHHGAAIGMVLMRASQKSWEIDMRLGMDCLIKFGKSDTDVEMIFEPYNITPVVESTGYLVGTATMIENVIKGKLGRLSEDFPPLRMPLDLDLSIPIDNQSVQVREKINLDIAMPRRLVDYRMAIRDVLVLREGVFIVLKQSGVQVR